MRRLSLLAVTALSLCGGAAFAEAPVSGFDLAGRDMSVKPGDDFFQYANGTAVKNLVIPPDRSSYGSFAALDELSTTRVREILQEAAKGVSGTPSDTTGKLGAIYDAFMNEAAVEAKGAAPLQPELNAIKAMSSKADFAKLNGLAQKTFLGALFDLSIQPDAKDPRGYAIGMEQSGLGLPDRDYYLDPQFAAQKQKYQDYAAHALSLAGWPDATAAAARVVAFETSIAKISWSRADSRDEDKTYNPMTLASLEHAASGFDWASFCAAADLGNPAKLVLAQNTAIEKIAALAGATDMQTLRDWAALHLVMNASPYLSKAFDDSHFAFFGTTLQGQPQQKERSKRAARAAETAMGDAIGQIYADKFYPPAARDAMTELTADLRAAFKRRLEANDWMAPQTKKIALQKLSTFYFQIGMPKRFRDYSGLTVSADDLYGDMERAVAFDWAFWTGHLGKPVDRDQWEMYPQTVNAYNEPLLNEVVFPAAILQPPFFDVNADMAVNFGAIGGVIGHEMTHSFDDQGRKHDPFGRLRNWWTKADAAKFNAREKVYGAQFAALTLPDLPGAHINPALTEGENTADLGGLTLALDAYHAYLGGKPAPVIDGLTGDQRVFLGWAQVWREKLRPALEKQLLTVDPHSPPIARVDIPMHNIDAWYTAFDVQPGETLYLPPDKRVRIW